MEEHKKNEEKKKQEEEEKLKKEQEDFEISQQKLLEEKEQKEQKEKEEKELLEIKNSSIPQNIIPESESEEEDYSSFEQKEILSNNIQKINKNSNIEVEKINILVNNIINKEGEKIEIGKESINNLMNLNNFYDEINDGNKTNKKMELNNLINSLNYVDEDQYYEERNAVNLEIPYYLTKEWVVKNMLN